MSHARRCRAESERSCNSPRSKLGTASGAGDCPRRLVHAPLSQLRRSVCSKVLGTVRIRRLITTYSHELADFRRVHFDNQREELSYTFEDELPSERMLLREVYSDKHTMEDLLLKRVRSGTLFIFCEYNAYNLAARRSGPPPTHPQG